MTEFRSDSYRNPDGVRQDSGYGLGRSTSQETSPTRPRGNGDRATARLEAERRSTERINATVDWAKREFPGLNSNWYPALASAAMMVKRANLEVSRENVLARVRSQWGEEFCEAEGLPGG